MNEVRCIMFLFLSAFLAVLFPPFSRHSFLFAPVIVTEKTVFRLTVFHGIVQSRLSKLMRVIHKSRLYFPLWVGSGTELFPTCVPVNVSKILRSYLWDMLRLLLMHPCSETDITRDAQWLDAKMSV